MSQLVNDDTHRHRCDLVRCQLQQWTHVGVATASTTITHGMAVFPQVPDDPVHTHGSQRIAMVREGFHALLTALVHPTCERIGADLQHLALKGKLALKIDHVSSHPGSPTLRWQLLTDQSNPRGIV